VPCYRVEPSSNSTAETCLTADTVATILLILVYGLLGFILLIFICGLLVFALLMWLGRTGTIYEVGDNIVRRIRGRQR
jgi:hypothetical protein